MTLKEATVLSLKVLKEVMEEKLNSTNIEVATVLPVREWKTKKEQEKTEKELTFFKNVYRAGATSFTQRKNWTSCSRF